MNLKKLVPYLLMACMLALLIGVMGIGLQPSLRIDFLITVVVLALIYALVEVVLALFPKGQKGKLKPEAAKKQEEPKSIKGDEVLKVSSTALTFFCLAIVVFLWQPIPLGSWFVLAGLLLGIIVGLTWAILSQKKYPR